MSTDPITERLNQIKYDRDFEDIDDLVAALRSTLDYLDGVEANYPRMSRASVDTLRPVMRHIRKRIEDGLGGIL